MRYLLDIGAIRPSLKSNDHIVNSSLVNEGLYSDELIMNYQPDNHITSYHTSVYYRGVRLEDIPSVTRSKLTYTQQNKTLRKLYMFTDTSASVITELINNLKK